MKIKILENIRTVKRFCRNRLDSSSSILRRSSQAILAKHPPRKGWPRFLPICHIHSMITGSQHAKENVVSDDAKPVDAIASWIRNGRCSRQIAVRFPPPIEFAVPIDREFKLQFRAAPGLAVAEAGELLTLA